MRARPNLHRNTQAAQYRCISTLPRPSNQQLAVLLESTESTAAGGRHVQMQREDWSRLKGPRLTTVRHTGRIQSEHQIRSPIKSSEAFLLFSLRDCTPWVITDNDADECASTCRGPDKAVVEAGWFCITPATNFAISVIWAFELAIR